MTLSAKQLRRAAREARKLAMECVEGTAPEFDQRSFCGCAAGQVIRRVHGVRVFSEDSPLWREARDIDGLVDGIVTSALIDGPIFFGLEQHGAVVFPLLALADAIDEQADAREAEEPSRGRSAP